MLFTEHCQAHNLVGVRPGVERIWRRVYHSLELRTRLRRALAPSKPPGPRLGTPSAFQPGAWVRILDEEEVRATLDERECLRGLFFATQQWAYCGGVYRVKGEVRRIIDDRGRLRAVGRTVTLEGADCGGIDGTHGCGRLCPLLFRDQWLAPAEAPAREPVTLAFGELVRVRSVAAIRATLDEKGRLGGLLFMPEMYAFAGRELRVHKRLTESFELDRAVAVAQPIYILDGLHCSGAVLGDAGPCDRACRLLWHGDWLEPAPAA